MKFLERKKQKFVRVRIGSCVTGHSGMKKPIKTINLIDTSVNDVYSIIVEAIKKKKNG